MDKCLFCYQALEDHEVDYHAKSSKAFFGNRQAPKLPFNLSDMEQLAKETTELSISVPGVQPKLSLGWMKNEFNNHHGKLTIMHALEGHFILKPQNAEYDQMPENEHLTMKLAELFKIPTVSSSMIRLLSGELCFITKRIDRNPDGSKNHMIDFLQILEFDDKYKGTMEVLGKTIGELSVNPLLDKLRFFEAAVFNFIVGNNDMHLKNYSMFLSEMGWILSPFYDLINVKLILPKDKEDVALLLGGKKSNFSKAYFDRLGQVLQLNNKQITAVYKRLEKWLPQALSLIESSFLQDSAREEYKNLIKERTRLFIVLK
jgi:serine/threonine-protein kinase HipA